MKRAGWACGALCLMAFVFTRALLTAQGPDVGPGDGGAALKNPFDPVPVRPKPVRPASPPVSTPVVDKAFLGKGGSAPASSPFPDAAAPEDPDGRPRGLASLKPVEKEDINRDLAVTPSAGPWMISLMSYMGPESPQMARQFAQEMRERYKLPAFVFNYAAEENRKEYERVKKLIDQQREALEAKGLPVAHKLRIRYTFVPDQCAVLIGEYPSEEAARRDLNNRIRKLPPPDPKRVKLDTKLYAEYDLNGERPDKWNAYKPPEPAREAKIVSVNPFQRAFLVPNPSIKVERKTDLADAYDMPTLRKLNRGEPYSLLECKKPLTLAITHFRTPTVTGGSEQITGAGGILGGLGFGKKKEREDYAAANANEIAEKLRKHFKLEAYVLHTRFNSVVCVGGYDTVDDPSMRAMKNLLQTRLRIPSLEMFPEPYLMKVPQ